MDGVYANNAGAVVCLQRFTTIFWFFFSKKPDILKRMPGFFVVEII